MFDDLNRLFECFDYQCDEVDGDNATDQYGKSPSLLFSERIIPSEVGQHQHYVEIHGIAHFYKQGLDVLASCLQRLPLNNQVLEDHRDDQESEDLDLEAALDGHQDSVGKGPSQEDYWVPVES